MFQFFHSISVAEAIGGIVALVAGTVALIKGVEYLWGKLAKTANEWITNSINKGFAPINQKLAEIADDNAQIRLSVCKNYIVRFLADVEQGTEVDEVEKQRFYENYDIYISGGGNSYLKDKVDRLRKEGKL